MEELRSRINQVLLEHDGMSVYEFAQKSGLKQTTINPQFNGTGNVSLQTVLALAKLFQDVDCNWLLLGVGEMKKKSEQPGITFHTENLGHHNNNNIGSGTQTITTGVPRPTMTQGEALAALIEQNNELIKLLGHGSH